MGLCHARTAAREYLLHRSGLRQPPKNTPVSCAFASLDGGRRKAQFPIPSGRTNDGGQGQGPAPAVQMPDRLISALLLGKQGIIRGVPLNDVGQYIRRAPGSGRGDYLPAVVRQQLCAGTWHIGAAAPEIGPIQVRDSHADAEVVPVVGRRSTGHHRAGQCLDGVEVRPWSRSRRKENTCQPVAHQLRRLPGRTWNRQRNGPGT